MSAPATTARNWNGVTIPAAGAFELDAAHTRVGFIARHLMVSKVRGSFQQVSGTLVVGEDPADSAVEATMETASIDTGAPDRDAHLRSPDFLDVEKYPTLVFRSKGLANLNGTEFTLLGDLTIKDVTREVELRVDFEGVVQNPWGKEVIAFTARTEIDREEFGITWNMALETGGVLVGKKVTIEIEAQAVRQ